MATENENKSVTIWNKVLETSLGLPFVKVDRDEFLTKELSKFCTPMEVMTALDDTPLKVLSKKEIDKLANQCINYHLTMVCRPLRRWTLRDACSYNCHKTHICHRHRI